MTKEEFVEKQVQELLYEQVEREDEAIVEEYGEERVFRTVENIPMRVVQPAYLFGMGCLQLGGMQ